MQGRTGRAQELKDVMRRQGRGSIQSDVAGSYTGCPADEEYPIPEQDADDL